MDVLVVFALDTTEARTLNGEWSGQALPSFGVVEHEGVYYLYAEVNELVADAFASRYLEVGREYVSDIEDEKGFYDMLENAKLIIGI